MVLFPFTLVNQLFVNAFNKNYILLSRQIISICSRRRAFMQINDLFFVKRIFLIMIFIGNMSSWLEEYDVFISYFGFILNRLEFLFIYPLQWTAYSWRQ